MLLTETQVIFNLITWITIDSRIVITYKWDLVGLTATPAETAKIQDLIRDSMEQSNLFSKWYLTGAR